MTDARQQLVKLMRTALVRDWGPNDDDLDGIQRAVAYEVDVLLDALLSDEGRALLEVLLHPLPPVIPPVEEESDEVLVEYLKERGVLVPDIYSARSNSWIIELPGSDS